MTYSVDIIAQQLFKTIKGFNHAIVLFTDDGQKTTDPNEARRFYAKDIQMMVNFVVDETTNEIVVNLSKDSDIAELQPMLSSIRNLANRYIIEYTVKTFGKSIAPKDFAYQAKNAIEEAINDELNELDCWDGYKKQGTKKGTGKNKDKRVNNCVPESSVSTNKPTPKDLMGQIRQTAKGVETSSDDRAHRMFAQQIEPTLIDLLQMTNNPVIKDIIAKNRVAQRQTDRRNANNIVTALWDLMNTNEDAMNEVDNGNDMNKSTPLNGPEQEILRRISKNVIDAPINHKKNVRPVFHSLKRKGLIEPFVKDGTVRKGYVITTKGKDMLGEGFSGWAGSARKSVNELGDARIVVKHKRSVDEEKRGARTRQIESIFIENSDGERFKFPSTNVTAAKAMARHVKEGGVPFDDFGQHIYGIMEELNQLKTFHRKNKRNDFFEDAAISEEIGTHIGNLRASLKSMSGKNGYNKQFESFTKESEDVSQERIDELKDETTTTYFDESIAAALPYVARIIETLRGRQSNETAVVEFARLIMGSASISLSEACDDDDDLDSPELQNHKDQLDEIGAWAKYLAPRMQNEELASKMTHMAENIGTVGTGHARMAMSAINVIRQNGRVAEASHIAAEKNGVEAAERAKISETFDKYTVRKIFGV